MPLHSLLEPASARTTRDACLGIEFDASLAIYIATSNDPTRVSEALRSRFHEFQIERVTGEAALQLAEVVASAAIQELQIPGFRPPEPRVAHKLAHLAAREIRGAIRDAACKAAVNGRSPITVADLGATDSDSTSAQFH